MCKNPEPSLICSKAPWGRKDSWRNCLVWRGPDSGMCIVSRFYRPGVCAVPCSCVCSHACTTLRQLQRGLLQMAASLGPISSSVRVVGGQEVSEARPALQAEALGLTREASSLRRAGLVGRGQHRPLVRSCYFWESHGGAFLPSSRSPATL